MNTKKILIAGVLLAGFSLLSGQTLNRPESIVYDAAHSRYLISNYGNGSDGSILAYDPSEDVYSNFNTTQSVGPKGLAIYGNTLYVSESGFINGFDLDTKQRVFNKQVGTVAINDLTVDNQGNLYTGDSNSGIIYIISTITGHVEEWVHGGLENVNGLLVDQENNRLLAVFYKANSPIMAFDLDTKVATTLIETNYASFDGITMDNCGRYLVSSQASKMVFGFDHDFSNPPVVVIEDLLKPADIYFNQELDILCIPEIDDSQIILVYMFKTCQSPQLLQPENSQADIPAENTSFSWNPIQDVDYYRFELAEDQEFTDLVTVEGTGTPEYSIESLAPSTTYYWRVSAYHQNQHTEYSEIWSFSTENSSKIESIELKKKCKLYPNPATESVNLYWGDEVPNLLKLYNPAGQLVLEFDAFNSSASSSQNIPLRYLPKGSYHCVVSLPNRKLWTRNLIVN